MTWLNQAASTWLASIIRVGPPANASLKPVRLAPRTLICRPRQFFQQPESVFSVAEFLVKLMRLCAFEASVHRDSRNISLGEVLFCGRDQRLTYAAAPHLFGNDER